MTNEAESSAEKRASGHPHIVAALLVLATLVAFLAIFSIWVNRQALNTDNWVNTSDKLLQNEEVKTQLSNYLADELFANVDVQAELEKTFPPRLAPLAGPAAGGLHQLAPKVAERALETSQAESAWSTANRSAHETLLKILNDEGSSVSTSGGEVTLDLKSLLSESSGQLGVAGKLASKIPPDAAQLTILKSDQLSAAQDISNPSLLHISMVFVRPAAQRTGVGLPLLLHVLDVARSMGYQRVGVWTARENSPARKLYERAGMTHTGKTAPLRSSLALQYESSIGAQPA